MKIKLAPPDAHNPATYFEITWEADDDIREDWHQVREWCEIHCTGPVSMSPLKDPRWGNVLQKHMIGFSNPDDAMIFRLHH